MLWKVVVCLVIFKYFYYVKGVTLVRYSSISLCFELSCDHSSIIATLESQIIQRSSPPRLHNSKTNWQAFREKLVDRTCSNIPLKSKEYIDAAVGQLTRQIQEAAWEATPDNETITKTINCSTFYKCETENSREKKIKKTMAANTLPHDKAKFNKVIK